ncbi:MAG: protein phosphatase 2C domain-containing protein [Propionibacteriaceae bacterium]
MTLRLHIATHSEIGPVRKMNQDSGYASANLLVVADGMGGAAAGDLASAVAVDTIRRIDAPTAGEHMLEVLAGAMHKANDRIADLVDADYSLEGMGTTVTGVLFDGSQFGLAHIGDSRAYLLHDSRLERLTHDHSWVQSLVDDGKINESEAAVHPHRSLLLKVLNGQPANDPDLTMVKVVVGDRLLICSDGLCGLVDDPVIEQAMQLPDLEDALRRLVDEALDEGGVDNITVILADVVDSEALAGLDHAGADGVAVLGAASERSIPAVETRLRAQTHEIPQVADADEPDDHEDTLVTDDPGPEAAVGPVPGAATGEPPHDPSDDEARYSPQHPQKRRFARPLIGLLVLLLIVGAGLGAAYAWTRTQYYVGAAGDKVAIFQGLSDSLPGVPLSRLYEVQPLSVSALPPYYQERVRANIDVGGLDAARQTVSELTDAAKRCAIVTPRPIPSPSVRPSTPASTGSVKPTVAATSAPPSTTPLIPGTSPSQSAAPRPTSSGTANPELNC